MLRVRSLPLLVSPILLLLSGCGGDEAEAAAEGTAAGDCRDGADNDADGLFDCDDDSCAGSSDCADTGDDTDANAAPSGAVVAIEPAAPLDDDDLTCTLVAQATDPDGDAVTHTFAWARNGADAGLSSATVVAALTSGGDTWTCTVTPTDGTLAGAPASASVTVAQGNRAPSAPIVRISPAAPTDDDALTCVIDTESVDPDGDAVAYAYAWSVGGADAGQSSATVNAALTEAGQEWTCAVTASDGAATSAAGTASVEIGPGCDLDGDGVPGASCGGGDCDDEDPTVRPLGGDTYSDSEDSDCDGLDCEGAVVGDAYIVVCRGSLTWSEASDTCRAAGYDGLASVLSSSEQDRLEEGMRSTGNTSTWIGIVDVARSGAYAWEDGSAVSYTNWASGEPSRTSGAGDLESCGVVQSNLGYAWNDAACGLDTLSGFACSAR